MIWLVPKYYIFFENHLLIIAVIEQEHIELEKRYRELTDLLVTWTQKCMVPNLFVIWYPILWWVLVSLKFIYYSALLIKKSLFIIQYYKQTQLEAMASEKAAAEFQLEKEIRRIQEVQVWRLLLCILICSHLYSGVQSLYIWLFQILFFGFACNFAVILNR